MKSALIRGDCLIEMKSIPNNSIDLVLADPPYGTTACKWDTVIPFEPMWKELKRIRKDNAAIVLFGSEPFSSHLRLSNLREFKYDWIWDKKHGANFVQANRRPLNSYEVVSIFCPNQTQYYPQKTVNPKLLPKSIIQFSRQHKPVHPTQKPVVLLEYLIKTYTLEGETVLDFCMGSGSTGVAAKNLNRRFIGIEQDEKYLEIAIERICQQTEEHRKIKDVA